MEVCRAVFLRARDESQAKIACVELGLREFQNGGRFPGGGGGLPHESDGDARRLA